MYVLGPTEFLNHLLSILLPQENASRYTYFSSQLFLLIHRKRLLVLLLLLFGQVKRRPLRQQRGKIYRHEVYEDVRNLNKNFSRRWRNLRQSGPPWQQRQSSRSPNHPSSVHHCLISEPKTLDQPIIDEEGF